MNQKPPHTAPPPTSKTAANGYGAYASTTAKSMYVKSTQPDYSYFGARYYDSGLSVWLSVDPLADKYPSMSPYMYTAGNPVMLVDPDGRWYISIHERTGTVRFVREKGDNYKSLIRFFGSEKIAQSYISAKQWKSIQANKDKAINRLPILMANKNSTVNKAVNVALNNPDYFDPTDPVEREKRNISFPRVIKGLKKYENYNCYEFAINVVNGTTIDYKNVMTSETFMQNLNANYSEVSVGDAKFGKTLMTTNYSGDTPQHVAVFGGTDKNGNIYIIEKPNAHAAPTTRKLGKNEIKNYKFYNPKSS